MAAAEDGMDMESMTDSQMEALQQLISVTEMEVEAALPLMQRSQWNVQTAITAFFDGERAVPSESAQSTTRNAPLLDDMDDDFLARQFPHQPRARGVLIPRINDPAPRIVPQPESQTTWRPPLILNLLLSPMGLVYRLLLASARMFSYIFPFLPRLFSPRRPVGSGLGRETVGRQPLSARETAARFIREFEEEFGDLHPDWYRGGYAQALDLASKEAKFLLVILFSPEHDDTSSWTRDTLLAPEVLNYLRDRRHEIILWGGSVLDSEAYQVSTALSCTKFPFAALISLSPQRSGTTMSVVARIAGPTTSEDFLSKLREAISLYTEVLAPIRAERATRQADRTIRQEQETAYERSLKQDQERTRRKREAEALMEKEQREERERAEAKAKREQRLSQWKRWRAQSIPTEPGVEMKDVSRIQVRLPSGERIVRRFAPDTPMEVLYALVECHEEHRAQSEKAVPEPEDYSHVFGFQLVSPIPRQVFACKGSVGEQVGRSGNLMVELIDDDEEEEEDDDA